MLWGIMGIQHYAVILVSKYVTTSLMNPFAAKSKKLEFTITGSMLVFLICLDKVLTQFKLTKN